ncbi:unnamed protein product [Dicrocoelium dendriticum]|nr:unnamed protein product [Dicrocoelium dendriticum]
MACSRKLQLTIVSLLPLLLIFMYALHQRSPQWIRISPLPIFQFIHQTGPESKVIHIVQMLRGDSASLRAITMLKSALYYQGRCRTDRLECCGNMSSSTGCQTNTTNGKQEVIPIHIHLIRDKSASVLVDALFRSLRMKGFGYSLHDLDKYLHLVSGIPNRHRAGPTALCKVFMESILPTSVEKVIVVDSDTLFNYDIHDLWDHFERFNKLQLIALAWEQQSRDPDCKHLINGPIPPTGVNGGVVLMHLKRMRTKGWKEMRNTALSSILMERGKLSQGEQDVYNTLIRLYPHVYYRFPCEWNTQLYSSVAVSCCPTFWPDRLPNEKDCITRISPGTPAQPNLLRLAHFDRDGKPEEGNRKTTFKEGSKERKFALSHAELIDRFKEMYTRFRAVPLYCFT